MGHSFRQKAQPETVPHYFAEFWAALSQRAPFGKARPILDADSGTHFRDVRSPYALATPAHKKRGKHASVPVRDNM